jgi:putative protease
MIGGRSGNRGLCAPPCRLPFDSGGSAHALSLRDLSLVEEIAGLSKAGVRSLKIEGRLKRPEYVAAAVHACVQSRAGERPDMDALRAVFSRGGFTKGYYMGRRGDAMFGTRQKEDVTAARPVLKELTRLYDRERQSVPVDFSLEIKAASPVRLEATDGFYKAAEAGAVPETARSAPITPERARALLEKTGGTPFKVRAVDCAIEEGLAFPASGLNALRRETLGTLTRERGRARPHTFKKMENMPGKDARLDKDPAVRVRVQSAAQLSPEMVRSASAVIVPVFELDRIGADLKTEMLPKLFVELPRVFFGFSEPLDAALKAAAAFGVTHAVAGNPGAVHRARAHGLNVHGDFGLNIANTLSLEALQGMGLIDATLSFELGLGQAKNTGGAIPTGIIAYGYIPLMIFRNNPAGTEGRAQGALTDRLGNKFRYGNIGDCTELYNMTPLYLADKKDDLRGFDFITLYFTHESADQCRGIMAAYRDGRASDQPKTRGLYYRKVL